MPEETLSPAQFLRLNVSEKYVHEDGDPADTYGIIGIRIGPNGVRMNPTRQLERYHAEGAIDSTLILGYLGSTQALVFSSVPFNLNDHKSINELAEDSKQLLTLFYQIQAAHRVIGEGEKLLATVRSIGISVNPDLMRGALILEEAFRGQRDIIPYKQARDTAERLRKRGVTRIEIRYDGSIHPDWLVEYYSQF